MSELHRTTLQLCFCRRHTYGLGEVQKYGIGLGIADSVKSQEIEVVCK